MIPLTPEHTPSEVAFPAIRLAHLDRTSVDADGDDEITTSFFTLHPITLARPPRGRLRASIVCGSCQETVTCTVDSDQEQRRWNRRRNVRRWLMPSRTDGVRLGHSRLHSLRWAGDTEEVKRVTITDPGI